MSTTYVFCLLTQLCYVHRVISSDLTSAKSEESGGSSLWKGFS